MGSDPVPIANSYTFGEVRHHCRACDARSHNGPGRWRIRGGMKDKREEKMKGTTQRETLPLILGNKPELSCGLGIPGLSVDFGWWRTYRARELLRSPGCSPLENKQLFGASLHRQRIFKQDSIYIQRVFIDLPWGARHHAGKSVEHDGQGPWSHGAYTLVQKTVLQAINYKCDTQYKTEATTVFGSTYYWRASWPF